MSCFIDSNIFIAFAEKRDERHGEAVELLRRTLQEKEFGTPYFSDYVFDECITFLYSRLHDKQKSVKLGDFLRASQFECIYTGPNEFEKSWQLFKKSQGLSFTDCTIIEVMKTHGIENLISFDSGFDKQGIKRVF